MTYSQLLDYIDSRIKANNNNEITGPIDNDVRKVLAAYFNDLIGDLATLNTTDKTSVVNSINSMLGGSLASKIDKDKGIELEAGKSAVLATGDWNNYTNTGFYRGNNLLNRPTKTGQHPWDYVIVIKHGVGTAYCMQIATDFHGTYRAYRTKESNMWLGWHYLLDERDLATIQNAIDYPLITEVDLNNASHFNTTTKQVTVPLKTDVIKFKTGSTSRALSNISLGNPAVATYTNIQFITEGQSIKFSGVTGGQFVSLNSGTYVAKNVNHAAGTFEIYMADGVTPFNSYGTPVASIVDMGFDTNDNFFLITVSGTLLPSTEYIIFGAVWEVDPGDMQFPTDNLPFTISSGTQGFDYKMDIKNSDPDLVYYSGGDVYKHEPLGSPGTVSINGNMTVSVEKVAGLPDGKEVIGKAAKNIEVTFVGTSANIAEGDAIVGTSKTIIGADKGSDIIRLFRDGTVNLITN